MSRAPVASGPALVWSLLALALATLGVALLRVAAAESQRLWASRSALTFDDLVLTGALGLLGVTAAWMCAGVTLTAATESLRCTQGFAGRLAARITPSVCRNLLTGLCGVAVLASPAGALPATAGATSADPVTAVPVEASRSPHCTRAACAAGLAGLPVPDRPLTAARPNTARPSTARPSTARPSTAREAGAPRLTVHAGDTLWDIAARHLPPDSSDAEVAAAWPAWFRANRARIGADPHLIHPGTRLRVPPRLD